MYFVCILGEKEQKLPTNNTHWGVYAGLCDKISHHSLWLMKQYRMIKYIDKVPFALHYGANVNEKSINNQSTLSIFFFLSLLLYQNQLNVNKHSNYDFQA